MDTTFLFVCFFIMHLKEVTKLPYSGCQLQAGMSQKVMYQIWFYDQVDPCSPHEVFRHIVTFMVYSSLNHDKGYGMDKQNKKNLVCFYGVSKMFGCSGKSKVF